MSNDRCPICKATLEEQGQSGDESQYICPNCGSFSLTGTAKAMLKSRVAESSLYAATLSYMIRRMQRLGEWAIVNSDIIHRAEAHELPDPSTQLENFILCIGQLQQHPGEFASYRYEDLRARIGAYDKQGVHFVATSAEKYGLIESKDTMDKGHSRLTMDGWVTFHRLSRGSTQSAQAFIAMAFGNLTLKKIVDDFLKPAVRSAGFNLIRLDDYPSAGSIDERLRVEIRRSSFLVADLTDGNAGAYWEAGFAEGLGKPVIYTCERSVFHNDGTHFDTNHLHTVLWDPSNPKEAADHLKATIRATLPEEAILDDKDGA